MEGWFAEMSVRAKVGLSVIWLAALAVTSGYAGYHWEQNGEQTHSCISALFCMIFSLTMAISACMAPIQAYRFFYWNDPNRKI